MNKHIKCNFGGAWCVIVCDQETSRMRRPWPTGRSATENKQKQTYGQNMYCVGLMDTGPVHPSFMGFKSSLCPTELGLGCQISQAFLTSYETVKCLRMCGNCNFPKVSGNIYSSMTAINQPLTGRNWTGRESSAD